MYRISYILSVFLLAACQEKVTNVQQKRPNVVFILVDDLGYHDLGFTGSTLYETPNVDRIAKEGFVFTQGYATSRVCSPSRASIMTGKFTARHGITDWIGAKSGVAWRDHNRHDKLLPATYVSELPKKDTTLAEAFKSEGYITFFAGKWHLGKEGSYPEDHGFDGNRGGWQKGSPIGGFFSPWKNPKLENNVNGENLSMRLARETSDFITQHKDTTFFAMLSFYAVHSPIQTTQEKWAKYREKARQLGIADKGYHMERNLPIRKVQDNPVYAGLVEHMDDAVGLVLQTLDELDLTKNTIIVFTSDNGGVASGDNFSTSNLPLRGGKGYQWEGGIREPYFIKVPYMQESKGAIDFPVTGADFYPTLLDLAGIPLKPGQHKDGLSLKPLILGDSLQGRPLYWHYPHYGNQGGDPSSIIREGNWKLIHYWEDGTKALYNLSKDPSEQKDVSKDHPDTAGRLSKKLLNWLVSVNARTPEVDSAYNKVLDAKRQQQIVNELLPNLEKERLGMLSRDFRPNADWWGSQQTKD